MGKDLFAKKGQDLPLTTNRPVPKARRLEYQLTTTKGTTRDDARRGYVARDFQTGRRKKAPKTDPARFHDTRGGDRA